MDYFKQRSNSLKEYEFYFAQASPEKGLEDIIQEIISEKGKCRLMDIGCGNAEALSELKEKFADKLHTTGIDLSEAGKLPDAFIKGDAITEAFPIEIDITVCFRVAHEIGSIRKLFEKTMACLSVDGTAYFLIRALKPENGKLEFEGKMKEADIDYLLALEKRPGQAVVHAAYEEFGTGNGTGKYIAGFRATIKGK